jgi:hypothetical protein
MDSSITLSWFLTYRFSNSPYWRRRLRFSGSLCLWLDRFLNFFLRYSSSNYLSLLFIFLGCLLDIFRFGREAERSTILFRFATAKYSPSLLQQNILSKLSRRDWICYCLIVFLVDFYTIFLPSIAFVNIIQFLWLWCLMIGQSSVQGVWFCCDLIKVSLDWLNALRDSGLRSVIK